MSEVKDLYVLTYASRVKLKKKKRVKLRTSNSYSKFEDVICLDYKYTSITFNILNLYHLCYWATVSLCG